MKKISFLLISALLVGVLFFFSCDNGSTDNSSTPVPDFDMSGTYSLSINSQEHKWVFSSDGTYQITGLYVVGAKNGTWSSKGNDITLSFATSGGGAVSGEEVFIAQKSGDNVTLKIKDSSIQVSSLLVSISIASNTVTLTKSSVVEPPEPDNETVTVYTLGQGPDYEWYYWIDEERYEIESINSSTYIWPSRIVVFNNDVYFTGYQINNELMYCCYWKNGKQNVLDSSNN